MTVLLDNTVLSNFSTVERPDLVRVALGDAAATVQEVQDELQAGVERGKVPTCDWSWLPVLQADDAEEELYHKLREDLNVGEAACLAIARQRGYRVLTDDRDAREIAMRMQIPISGTLGLLIRLVEGDILSIDEAEGLLKRMIAAGYRSPVTRLTELL